jgi:hypothetical protein
MFIQSATTKTRAVNPTRLSIIDRYLTASLVVSIFYITLFFHGHSTSMEDTLSHQI